MTDIGKREDGVGRDSREHTERVAHALPVAVVTPVYNRAELLARALEGVAEQQRPPAEVIVVDDCSTDDSASVAARFGARVIRQATNQGAAAARNAGLRATMQPWVAFLDSDDEWLPSHLATVWSLRDGHVLVGASSLLTLVDSPHRRWHGPMSAGPVVIDTPAKIVFPDNFLTASGIMVRRDAALRVGGFRQDLRFSEDYDLWLRLLAEGTGISTPEITCLSYRHDGSKSLHGRPTARAVVMSYRGSWWCSDRLLRQRSTVEFWDDLRTALREGRRRDANRLAAGIALDPRRWPTLVRLFAWRFRVRRRAARIDPDGGPAIAVLPGAVTLDARLTDALGGRSFVDLRECSFLRVLVHMARRPTSVAVVGSRFQAALATRFGVLPIPATRAAVDAAVNTASFGRLRAVEPEGEPVRDGQGGTSQAAG